jgi:hypothetical protein
MNRKYTTEFLAELAKQSSSISDMCRKLGNNPHGGSHGHISKRVKKDGIDVSHFEPVIQKRGPHRYGNGNKRTWQSLLILSDSDRRVRSYHLRRALIESGVEYICARCGQPPIWKDKILTLEVNHKDGNWRDSRRENLEFCCPNCHSQEPTSTSSKAIVISIGNSSN